MYTGNGTLLRTFNRRGTFFFQQKNLQVKKKSYHPTNLASNFEVLVTLKDIIILKAICAQHLDAHTLIAEAAQIKSLRSTFENLSLLP